MEAQCTALGIDLAELFAQYEKASLPDSPVLLVAAPRPAPPVHDRARGDTELADAAAPLCRIRQRARSERHVLSLRHYGAELPRCRAARGVHVAAERPGRRRAGGP